MLAQDFRNEAWEKLKGKWDVVVIIALIWLAIMGVCGALAEKYVGSIAMLVVVGPLSLSWAGISKSVIMNKPLKIENLFDGFRDFSRSFVAALLINLYAFLWALLFVIPGIVKLYAYSMSYYILADNPNLTASQALKRSDKLMYGNKWRLFCLHCSFIGWFILCALTFGILLLWVIPYINAAVAAFYRNITGQSDQPEEYTKVDSDDSEWESKKTEV